MRGSITIESAITPQRYYALLSLLDYLFACLVVTPCVLAYWRGTWMLVDIYTEQLSPVASGLLSTCIGFLGHAVFTSIQNPLGERLHPDKNRLIYYASSRLYTACYAFTCVNSWRGPWNVLDVRFDRNLAHLVVTVAVGTLALIAVRGLKNVLAAPFVIVVDNVKGYFEVATMFRMPMGEKTFLYILDCIFSILIVGTLVVFVWRGSWLLIDIFLFPDDFTLSSWSSLALGYAIVATAFLLQPIMRYICERLTGTARLLVADIFIIFALFGTVNVWRGIWNLLDIYFLPDNRELSCWICHWVSLIILVLCRCSNSLLIRGVYIDAEEPEGKCVIFPCYYLRILFGKKKLEKLNLDAEAMKIHAKENEATSNKINTISNTVEENPTKEPK